MKRILFVFLTLCGCTTIMTQPGSPIPVAIEAVNGKGKSIVLIGLNVTLDDKAVDSVAQIFEFGLANFSLSQPMTPVSPSPLISEEKEKGWIYLALEPGIYNFWIIPPKTALKNYRFQLDVPGDSSLIYAGSVNIRCWSGGYFGRLNGCTSEPTLGREPEAAKAISRVSFSKYGDPSVRMMQPYGELTSLKTLTPLFPMALVTTAGENLTSPDWTSRPGVAWTPEVNLPNVTLPTRDLGSLPPPIGAGLALAYFTVLGVFSAGNAIADAGETRSLMEKREPCQKELAQELLDFDLAGDLRVKLRDEVQNHGAVELVKLNAPDDLSRIGQEGFKTILHADIQHVGLRECRRGTFCVHVALRARILEANGGKLLYEKSLIYSTSPIEYESSPFRWTSLPFHAYDRPTESLSACRLIDAYCGEGGRKLFREELMSAIEFITKSIFRDLGLKSELGASSKN